MYKADHSKKQDIDACFAALDDYCRTNHVHFPSKEEDRGKLAAWLEGTCQKEVKRLSKSTDEVCRLWIESRETRRFLLRHKPPVD